MIVRISRPLGIVLAGFAVLVGVARQRSLAQEPKSSVQLHLAKATAERSDEATYFRCEVVLENATGNELIVKSCYYSACDGLELEVTRAGKGLARRRYTSHQSPYTFSPRSFALKQGKTTFTLVFPNLDLGEAADEPYQVRVEGTLPGSGYNQRLVSNTVDVRAARQGNSARND